MKTGIVWQVDFTDAMGQRRRVTVRGTKKQADDRLADELKKSGQAVPSLAADDRQLTLAQYAARWLERIDVRPRTRSTHGDQLRRHILPVYGIWKLRELHRGHVKALLARKRAGGLAKNSVRLIRATLSVMLGDAVEDGILQTNPALGVARRGRRRDAVTDVERSDRVRVMTHEQLEAFLLCAARTLPRRTATLFMTLADTGMRPSEALALRWAEDFDSVARMMRVAHSVEPGTVGGTGRGQLGPTKTGRMRRVDLTPRLIAALSGLQAEGEAEALAADTNPSPWIFPATHPTEHGLTNYKHVARTMRAVVHRAGLPQFTPYDFRHTYASQQLAAGAPPTYVAAQLGDSVATVLRFYARWIPGGDTRWTDRLAAIRAEASARVRRETTVGRPAFGTDVAPISENPEVSEVQLRGVVGSPGWARTSDPLINSQVLYRLSYRGISLHYT